MRNFQNRKETRPLHVKGTTVADFLNFSNSSRLDQFGGFPRFLRYSGLSRFFRFMNDLRFLEFTEILKTSNISTFGEFKIGYGKDTRLPLAEDTNVAYLQNFLNSKRFEPQKSQHLRNFQNRPR